VKIVNSIAVVNGPNLNLLGSRETHHYGTETLDAINRELLSAFKDRVKLEFFQSNHEGAIIDFLQALKNCGGIVINPGAFTHTSVAIRDALLAINLPTIEVHLSNVFRREEFRKTSFVSDIALGVISGLGARGYHFALLALLDRIKQ